MSGAQGENATCVDVQTCTTKKKSPINSDSLDGPHDLQTITIARAELTAEVSRPSLIR